MVPTDLRYTNDHEWVRVDGDEATIGITAYAADQLGDIVFVELPDAGRTVALNSDKTGTLTLNQRRPGQRHRHPAKDIAFGGAIDPGRILGVPVDARDAGPGRPNVERSGDEQLGKDDGHGRERDADTRDLERFAKQTLASEDEQQGKARH